MKSICIYLVIGDDNLLWNTTAGPEHYVCLVRHKDRTKPGAVNGHSFCQPP